MNSKFTSLDQTSPMHSCLVHPTFYSIPSLLYLYHSSQLDVRTTEMVISRLEIPPSISPSSFPLQLMVTASCHCSHQDDSSHLTPHCCSHPSSHHQVPLAFFSTHTSRIWPRSNPPPHPSTILWKPQSPAMITAKPPHWSFWSPPHSHPGYSLHTAVRVILLKWSHFGLKPKSLRFSRLYMIWLSTTCQTSSPVSHFLISFLAIPRAISSAPLRGLSTCCLPWLVWFSSSYAQGCPPLAFTQRPPPSLSPTVTHPDISYLPLFCVFFLSLMA